MAELLNAIDKLLNESSVAKHLDVEVKTLQSWRTRGCGPPFLKIGRLVKYNPDSVRTWVESRQRSSTSEK